MQAHRETLRAVVQLLARDHGVRSSSLQLGQLYRSSLQYSASRLLAVSTSGAGVLPTGGTVPAQTCESWCIGLLRGLLVVMQTSEYALSRGPFDCVVMHRYIAGTPGARLQLLLSAVAQQIRALMRNYKQLSKFKLSALVVASAATGFIAGSEDTICWRKLAWTSVGTFGAAACANTLNQVLHLNRRS